MPTNFDLEEFFCLLLVFTLLFCIVSNFPFFICILAILYDDEIHTYIHIIDGSLKQD